MGILAVLMLTLGVTSGCSDSDDDQTSAAGSGTSDGGYEIPGDMAIGSRDAPVTIIEYASVTCGACGAFHAAQDSVFKKLKETYIDTGKVRLIFRELPTQPKDRSIAGFMLARCLPEERYFAFINILFKKQAEWVPSANAFDYLKGYAESIGMSNEAFVDCLTNDEEIKRIQTVAEMGFKKYGVQSTPSFVINGTTYTNMPWEEFQSILNPLVSD